MSDDILEELRRLAEEWLKGKCRCCTYECTCDIEEDND